ncbi:MAG TPA: hypothetical protein GX532_03665 [Clostridia bacterium]|nr:hypothetical protein [Clostridia bacterium]HHY06060.1 hypothetical protein [Clostridia bacterium]
MSELLRAHLVFKEREKKLLQEISKYCQITGWDATLESASTWAKEGGGEDPNLFLINSTVYFSKADKQKSAKTKEFLRILLTIKEERCKSQIVLLLPEKMIVERDLLVNLIKMQVYNFWFLDSFAEEDVHEFILTRRTLVDVEKYLLAKEKELQHLKGNNNFISGKGEKLFQPYHIKSNILTFWSENNTALNCGLALLTAFNLAKRGFQVALVETVSSVPSLAGSLAVSHPYFNTSHALSMYLQGNNDFIKNCLNHAQKHLTSPYVTEDYQHLRYWPSGFYFLPDGKREDNASEKEMQEAWPAFIMDLSRFIIFEQGFHFLIFLAAGRNFFNHVVLENLTYLKFITVDMLPSSVFYGLGERKKGRGKVQIIGTNKLRGINKELKGLREEPFLYPPQTFLADFLQYVYTQDYRKITRETQTFINRLMEISGVKVPALDIEKKGLGERLKDYKKTLFSKVL